MPNIRLVAIDMDDTLLTPDLQVAPAVRNAIEEAQRRGVLVTLATGRMFRAAIPFARQLGIDLPLIVYQGAMVKEAGNDELLYHVPVPPEPAREIVDLLKEEHLHINLYIDDHLHMEKIDPEAFGYIGLAKVPVTLTKDHGALLEKGSTTKILAIGDPDHLTNVEEQARQKWGGAIYITRSKPYYLEFMNRNAGKGSALAFLADRLQIPREATMAIGDSYNDLDMLKYAGVGVAMGNGVEEAKAVADWVTTTNEDDGVAVALRRWVFGE
ncbi:Cof-type HAD-IIB family hydrolase [Heliobacillus mobilis]|uniref:Cof-type HAD-IIB family hydrolase n=1 Tax=Heliobacterium mobile TaxID=28064 RepID=A0A6I3SMV6_HELMO|nr:Cof-type HAD-IIB family hydrolase [Heliobacterium mobile]MTV50320.1 Cof-type HAD-IIB family hydrolase [Heliobacterium mobile]